MKATQYSRERERKTGTRWKPHRYRGSPSAFQGGDMAWKRSGSEQGSPGSRACCRRRSKSLENLRFLCFRFEDIGNKEESFGVLLLPASACCVSVARHRMGKRRRKHLEEKGKTKYETSGRKTLCFFKPIKLVVSKF